MEDNMKGLIKKIAIIIVAIVLVTYIVLMLTK